MPTLNNRKTKSGHCIVWRSHPKHDRPSTYQVTPRAIHLLRDLGFEAKQPGDSVDVPHQVCRPLRLLGDLHFIDESAGTVDLVENPVKSLDSISTTELSDTGAQTLRAYITAHPRYEAVKTDLDADISTLRSRETGEGEDDSNRPPTIEDLIEALPLCSDRLRIIREWRPQAVPPVTELTLETVRNFEPAASADGIVFNLNRNELDWLSGLRSIGVDRLSASIDRFDRVDEVATVATIDRGLTGDLQYRFTPIRDGPRHWQLTVTDRIDDADTPTDLEFAFTHTYEGTPVEIHHTVIVRDGWIARWETELWDTEYPETVRGEDELSDVGSHAVVHEQAALLALLERLIGTMDDYALRDWRRERPEADIESIRRAPGNV